VTKTAEKEREESGDFVRGEGVIDIINRQEIINVFTLNIS